MSSPTRPDEHPAEHDGQKKQRHDDHGKSADDGRAPGDAGHHHRYGQTDHFAPDRKHDDDADGEHGHAHDGEHDDHGHAHGGPLGWLAHLFAPHSHDAADSVDDALAGSEEGIRAVKVSLAGLGVTAVAQLFVALASGSVALLADTIHNFADASTAIPLWIAFSISRRQPTRRYTYGYGRAEDIAGVFIILMIAGSAALAGYESLHKLINPEPISNLLWVAIAGVAGFIGNEMVAVYRIRTGERIGSAALVADGYHARTDGLTSLAVLVGAGGVWLGFPAADPIIGLLITVAILLILKGAATDIWRRLMDAVSPEIIDKSEKAARGVRGVEDVSAVRARWIGHTIHAEVVVIANRDMALAAAHDVAEEVRHAMLHAVPKLSSVTVHVDPCDHSGDDPHGALAHHGRADGRETTSE